MQGRVLTKLLPQADPEAHPGLLASRPGHEIVHEGRPHVDRPVRLEHIGERALHFPSAGGVHVFETGASLGIPVESTVGERGRLVGRRINSCGEGYAGVAEDAGRPLHAAHVARREALAFL